MTDRSLASLLEAVRLPLADLLRAAADWLDDEPDASLEDPEDDTPSQRWVVNDHGGVDPA